MTQRTIQLPITSRMGSTPLLQRADPDNPGKLSNVYHWGTWQRPNIPDDDSDRFVRMKQQHLGRLDLLAYHYLGDPNFWWVIADVNNILDQFTDDVDAGGLPIGETIRIPTRERLLSILGQSETGAAISQPE